MGDVCWGGGISLVMLPVQRPSLCTSLTGMKCMCEVSLFVSAVEWSSLCNTFGWVRFVGARGVGVGG